MRHFLIFTLTVSVQVAQANLFLDYIQKEDPHFAWQVVNSLSEKNVKGDVVQFTSQQWRTAYEVSPSVWRHSLLFVRPSKIKSSQSLLFIGGGRELDHTPEEIPERWARLAQETGSVVVEVRNVPNQPMRFFNETRERSEDDLVAYSWKQAISTGDLTWSVRMPMVKSIVRAMDVVQALARDNGFAIDHFVLAGASKRGWTTWLTAAMDQRVNAIVPMVIDVLNVQRTFSHMRDVYGSFPEALQTYVEQKLGENLLTPQFAQLMAVEDPFAYIEELQIPKLIINATGDRYFLPDSSQFYFHDLKGVRLLRYMPNVDHHMQNSDAFDLLESFYQRILSRETLPQMTWETRADGALIVKSKSKPEKALLWSAHNPESRDFRLEKVGKAFAAAELLPESDGTYVAPPPASKSGATAYFVELSFGGRAPLKLTTDVVVRCFKEFLRKPHHR